jgi:hypothetical protein
MTTRAALALPTLVLALFTAGCDGGSGSPGVASLGSPGTTTTTGGSSAPIGPLGRSSGGGATLSLKTADAAKFAACMRTHGVPNFPDPSSQGAIAIGPSSGIDPGSPTFNAAQQRCRTLLPNGGRPSPQQQAKMRTATLAFSACMRKHGVANFPDPTFSDGGAQLKITVGAESNLDPRSPVFQAAQKACAGKLPGQVGRGTAITK